MKTTLSYFSNMLKHCNQMLMKEELALAAEGPSHLGSTAEEEVQ